MANEFLRLKWKKIFQTHDINKDNVLTIEDADIISENFAKFHQLNTEDAENVKRDGRTYYREWILKGLDHVDEKTFVENMEKAYLEDKAKFRADASRFFSLIINIMDSNHDKMISEREFEIMMKSTGFKKYDKKYMEAYPQIKPGYISLDVYLDSFVEFQCNHDQNNITVEKPRHYGFGIIDELKEQFSQNSAKTHLDCKM